MARFQAALVEHLAYLRAFAQFLARDRSLAEDLVQETVLRALCNADKFESGTNLRAWLSTILRNQFYNELRSRSRMAAYAGVPRPSGRESDQELHLEMRDFMRAYRSLPAVQREALSLVGANGYSYEEAAQIAGCAQGTVKSRVSRGRAELARLLDGETPALKPVKTEDFPVAA